MFRLQNVIKQGHLHHLYMLFFSLSFSVAFWVVFLRSRGLSFVEIGLLETVYHIAGFVAEIPTGIIADRFGRRTSLLLGRIASICSSALTLATRNIAWLALAFVLSSLSSAFHSGAFEAIVYDGMSPEAKRDGFTKRLGKLNSTLLLGGAVAALTGGWVAEYSLYLLYILNIASDLLALVMLLMFKEVKAASDEHTPSHLAIVRQAYDFCRKNPSLIGIFLISGFTGAAVVTSLFYGQSYLRDAGIPFTWLGGLSMLTGLASFLPARAGYRLETRLGWRRCLRLGLLFIGGIILSLGLIPLKSGLISQAALFFGFILFNACYETLYPLISNQLNIRIPPEQRATLLSANGMAFSIFMMIIFPSFGLIGDWAGLRWGYIIVGSIVLLFITGLNKYNLRS